MSSLKTRLKRLEDPRTPAQRRRQVERAQKSRELMAQYQAKAEEWPEGYEDLLEANEELHRALGAVGFDFEQLGDSDAVHRNPAASEAIDRYMEEQERFWQGYSSGFGCEDCGRPADQEPGNYEGRCRHCSGVTGNSLYFYKRVCPLDGLRADIDVSGGSPHGKTLKRILERRLRDVGS